MTSPENTPPSSLAESETSQEALSLGPPSTDPPPLSDSSTENSMEEYYALQQELLLTTLAVAGVVFPSVWWFYGFDTAISYLIGAVGSLVYLRMLARGVERLGPNKKLGKNRLALFVVLIVVAARLNHLQVLPTFFGFLTFKAAIISYMLRITFQR